MVLVVKPSQVLSVVHVQVPVPVAPCQQVVVSFSLWFSAVVLNKTSAPLTLPQILEDHSVSHDIVFTIT